MNTERVLRLASNRILVNPKQIDEYLRMLGRSGMREISAAYYKYEFIQELAEPPIEAELTIENGQTERHKLSRRADLVIDLADYSQTNKTGSYYFLVGKKEEDNSLVELRFPENPTSHGMDLIGVDRRIREIRECLKAWYQKNGKVDLGTRDLELELDRCVLWREKMLIDVKLYVMGCISAVRADRELPRFFRQLWTR